MSIEISTDKDHGLEVEVAFSKATGNHTLNTHFYQGQPYIQMRGGNSSLGTRMTVEEIEETILALTHVMKRYKGEL